MKKSIAVSIISALLMSTSIATAADVYVSFPKKSELVDGQYIVSVSLSENTGFSAVQLELSYNSDVVKCDKIIPGKLIQEMLIDTNPAAVGKKAAAILSSAQTDNVTEDGVLASFVFEKPKDGNPEFEFAVFDLTSADGKKLDYEMKIQDNYGEKESDGDKDKPSGSSRPSSGSSSGGGHHSGQASKPKDDIITVQPVGKPEEEPKTKAFSDVPDTHWAKEYIYEAVKSGLASGYEDGTFRPDKEMTRAEFTTLIWNMAGKPEASERLHFSDVSENDWFFKQVAWAYENGYITGVTEAEFAPDANITREQAMTILYRYHGSPKSEKVINTFADANEVADYAKNAMNWAVANKIIFGTSQTTLSPKANATRAEITTITVRFTKQLLPLD